MIHVLRAETGRLWARRMTRFFPLLLALLIAAGVVIAYFVIRSNHSNPDFVTDIANGPNARGVLGPLTVLLPVMAFVIGASYIGADVKTGMLEQILTWEPRRLRLLVGRCVASLVSVAVLAMLLAAFWVALMYGLTSAVGTTAGTSGELWRNIALVIVRTGVASGVFAMFGLGVTLLLNNSVGSIVGFVIYWFIVENIVLSAFLPRVAVYMPVTNASSFASGAPVERIVGSVFRGGPPDTVVDHNYLVAGAILLGWTVLALILAAIAFRRRDIA